jgi:hypothetical protein
MGIFSGLKEAKVFENGRKLPEGEHTVEIDKCLVQKSARHGTELYIVEYICRKSNSAEVGGRYTWVQDSKDFNVAQGAIKQFALAVLKADKEKDLAHYEKCVASVEAAAEASVSKDFFKGKQVQVTTMFVDTKNIDPVTKLPRKFLRHDFRPVMAATA